MDEAKIIAAVRAAASAAEPLSIQAGGTRDFLGPPTSAQHVLEACAYHGIISYEPTELVVRVRAGTLLSELQAVLDEQRQLLPFEPPAFGESATIGGIVASGIAGPRRMQLGGVRDSVLGIGLVNGQAQKLEFGGQVMKNVAGYDLSRLMVGAMGTLGLITDCSLKVLPQPEAEHTQALQCDLDEAIRLGAEWGRRPLPISAFWWADGELAVRLSGTGLGVEAAARQIGGDQRDNVLWEAVREQSHSFFERGDGQALWRLSLPPAAPALTLAGEQAIEWGGAQRWLKTNEDAGTIRSAAQAAGGHASLWRGGDSALAFTPLSKVELALQQRLKRALDPEGIFNPGRLYAEAL